MLLSMTGFGEAKTHEDGVTLISEIKTVNNRFLKTTIRLPEPYVPLESRVESLVHQYVDRGSVLLSVKMIQDTVESSYSFDFVVLRNYLRQINLFRAEQEALSQAVPGIPSFGELLRLPGMIQEKVVERDSDFLEKSWQHLSGNLSMAFEKLQAMRKVEGASMLKDLQANCSALLEMIGRVEAIAPTVIDGYRARLTETVGRIMNEKNLPFTSADLVREIALFVDKCDISEETVRFRSHLQQFDSTMSGQSHCGKKLDFLVQEMFREVNTIGSKANCSQITNEVVEMKSMIERIREMIQNIE